MLTKPAHEIDIADARPQSAENARSRGIRQFLRTRSRLPLEADQHDQQRLTRLLGIAALPIQEVPERLFVVRLAQPGDRRDAARAGEGVQRSVARPEGHDLWFGLRAGRSFALSVTAGNGAHGQAARVCN